MVKWNIGAKKNPTYKKINSTKLYSRLKILGAGILAGLSVVYIQSNQTLAIFLVLFSASIFVWDIFSQTKSAIEVEKRISDLEESVKKYQEKLETLENTDDTKSDSQSPSK